MKNKISIYSIFLIFLTAAPFILRAADRNSEWERAVYLEKEGRTEEALIIYQALFDRSPSNSGYYLRLKNIYQRSGDEPSLLQLQKQWAVQFPRDPNAQAEYAVLLLANNKDRQGYSHIDRYISGPLKQNFALYCLLNARLYRLDDRIPELMEYMRKKTGDLQLLDDEYILYLTDARRFELLTVECMAVLQRIQGADLPQALQYVFQLPSDSPFFDLVRTELRKMRAVPSAGLNFLAEIELHTDKPEEFFLTVLSLGKDKTLFSRQLRLIDKASEKGWTSGAVLCVDSLLSIYEDRAIRQQLLVKKAGYHETLYKKGAAPDRIIGDPFDGSLITPLYEAVAPERSRDLYLASSIYDSLLDDETAAPEIRLEILLRTSSIRQYSMNDYDGARQLLLKAMPGLSRELTVKGIIRLTQLMAVQGEGGNALEFIENAPEHFSLPVRSEDELLPQRILLEFLYGDADSLDALIYPALSLLGEDNALYNDLLHFSYFYHRAVGDSAALPYCIKAEEAVFSNRYAEALALYRKILNMKGPLAPIAMSRLIQLLRVSDASPDQEEVLWKQWFELQISDPVMQDLFTVKYGEFLLFQKENADDGLAYLEDFLLKYPQSPYFENVRTFLREYLMRR